MSEWLTSARRFSIGMLRRFWAWIVGAVLAALDAAEWVTGKAVDVPNWAVWTLLGVGLGLAVVGTYHETRIEGVRASAALASFKDRRKAIERIANQQASGNGVKYRCQTSGDSAYEDLARETSQWSEATRQVLLEEAPEYVPEFERDQGSAFIYSSVTKRMSDLMVFLDGRLERLSRILDRLGLTT